MNCDKPLYSIIIPVLNISESLIELTKRIKQVMDSNNYNFEILFIDDGSSNPETLNTMKKVQNDTEASITIITFFKNAGQQAAILAGINNAKGSFLITMDGDLEHRPEDLASMIDKQKVEDYDVVFGNFKEKTHGPIKKFFSYIYTSIERNILKYPEGTKRSAFWIMKREVGSEVLKFNTLNPSLSVLIIKVTNHIGSAEIVQGKRSEGESAYTVSKLIFLASSLFINNSGLFLRSYFVFGLLLLISSVLLFLFDFIASSWLKTLVFSFIFFGFFIIGEYLFRIIQNIERHPLYSIREIIRKD
jgi:dolichol-phosphate mannosyltransferase/undecaprenyl-phosphate 4-deoxy-4-formamido-L-arabinose transferase